MAARRTGPTSNADPDVARQNGNYVYHNEKSCVAARLFASPGAKPLCHPASITHGGEGRDGATARRDFGGVDPAVGLSALPVPLLPEGQLLDSCSGG